MPIEGEEKLGPAAVRRRDILRDAAFAIVSSFTLAALFYWTMVGWLGFSPRAGLIGAAVVAFLGLIVGPPLRRWLWEHWSYFW